MAVLSYIKSRAIGIICIVSFLFSFTYNQINLQHLPKHQIREGHTVKTNDDTSYLIHPSNYIRTGEWKSNRPGEQAYFTRTPGYGLLYFAIVKTVGFNDALLYLKLLQLLLFSISIYWLYSIVLFITKNKTQSLISACLYGITPFAIGFLAYTLTVGITPALVLLYIFLLFHANDKKNKREKSIFYFFASLTFSYLLIVRAPLGFLGVLLPVFLLQEYWKKNIKKTILKLLLFGSIAFSLTLIWQYRNYKITNEYVGLHPIYYADNNSIYRPTFKEFWNFVGGWAQEGHVAHAYMVPMWKAAIKGDTAETYIDNALKTFPKPVISYFGKDRLAQTFKKYQKATLFQKEYYDQELPMPKITPKLELEVMADFKQLTKEYKQVFWFDYHILSPLKVFKTMAFHSNLSLYIFQKTYRGNWLMEAARILFYSLHSLLFLSLIVSLFLIRKNDWIKSALTIAVFIYVFYLCYFQRGIEERYTLPILPVLLIILVGLIDNLNPIKSRRNSR